MLTGILVIITFAIGLCRAQHECAYSQYLQPGGQSFIIQSPGYPVDKYMPAASCIWRAFTNTWAKIELQCADVDLPQSRTGCLDKLYVSDTENGYDGVMYCGKTKIYHDSQGPQLTVQIVTEPYSPGGKFSCYIRAYNVTTSSGPPQPNCACGYSFRPRIVGGTETGINEFPFMAAIISNSLNDLLCGASIVTERFAVSAAHCVKGRDKNDLGLLVGDHDISTGKETNSSYLTRISNFWTHPYYNASTITNDVSVLEVSQRLLFNSRVGPVCLPFNYPQSHVNEYVQAIGWGSVEFGGLKADKLQKVTLKVIDINECKTQFGSKVNSYGQLCTYGGQHKDACQYDSGGPVVWVDPYYSRYMLVGILSYGRGCGLNYPSVNTRVFAYLGWIEEMISKDYYCVV